MSMTTITQAVTQGRVLVSDGAWGTFLQNKGMQPGDCPELWVLERGDDVKEIAQAYFAAGADMVQTDSFGGSPFKLEHYGLRERAAEINEAAARLSAEAAAGAGGDRWVIASVGPSGVMLMMGEVSEEELFEGFRVQVEALAKGGANAICIETMSDLQEAELAVRAAKECTDCEVIATFTFDQTVDGDYRTMMGVTPEQAASAMVAAGADIIGSNCGNGIARMKGIVERMRAAEADAPILVHANAGLPIQEGGGMRFPEGPADMAAQVAGLVEAGANIIGGCCGTTPDHIRAIRGALAS